VEEEFSRIIASGRWGSPETPCGPGSTLRACEAILDRLPEWIRAHRVASIIDLGCGDFHWMSRVDLAGVEYDGHDVVRGLIEENRARHGAPNVRFHHSDILGLAVPRADLVLCKDVLTHLPTAMALAALGCILRSGGRLLAATTAACGAGRERPQIPVGGFAPVDLEAPPFSLGPPLDAVEVPRAPGNPRKLLALWRVPEQKP
jgi:methyltransferase family protein